MTWRSLFCSTIYRDDNGSWRYVMLLFTMMMLSILLLVDAGAASDAATTAAAPNARTVGYIRSTSFVTRLDTLKRESLPWHRFSSSGGSFRCLNPLRLWWLPQLPASRRPTLFRRKMFPAPSSEDEEAVGDKWKTQTKMDKIREIVPFWNPFLPNNEQPSEEEEACPRGTTRIPNRLLEELSSSRLKLPFEMEDEAGGLTLRHMRQRDIDGVLKLILDEFGPLPPSVDKTIFRELQYDYECWSFSILVRSGLLQRLETTGNDHAVLCLTTPDEKVVAMAELSLQPPDPTNVAPPYVIPYWMKQVLCIIRRTGTRHPTPYLSNVLVAPRHRRRGYGRLLVAACEGLAREWILASSSTKELAPHISLHVDADPFAGRSAQRLYAEWGYRVVPASAKDNKNDGQKQYQWMEKASGTTYINGGLHMIEGIPLLYMRKLLQCSPTENQDAESDEDDNTTNSDKDKNAPPIK